MTGALEQHSKGALLATEARALSRSLRDPIEKRVRAGESATVQGDIESYLGQYPADAYGWVLLGLVLRSQGKAEAAVLAHKRALGLAPRAIVPLTNLGNALKDLGRFDEAVAIHDLAVAADPASVAHWLNLGVALRERGDLHGALRAFDRVQALAPEDVNGHWDRAQVLLMLGDYREGWREFEWRWRLPEHVPQEFHCPRWDGQVALASTLFVWPEQGFGDSILASRFLPMARERVGRLIVGCRSELAPIMAAIPGVDQVVKVGEVAPRFDLHCPIMSLPGLFCPEIGRVPPPVRTEIPPASRRRVAPLLARGDGRFKVGIVWSGSATFKGNALRATSLDRFLPLAEEPCVQLYSLQKGPQEADLDRLGVRGLVVDLAPALTNFADTAAAVDALDLVVMTDSSVAHLAGSRGRPVWNLLGYVPYWLYLRQRTDCPWYPSMRLFRQPAPGDWDAVFRDVRASLRSIVADRR